MSRIQKIKTFETTVQIKSKLLLQSKKALKNT